MVSPQSLTLFHLDEHKQLKNKQPRIRNDNHDHDNDKSHILKLSKSESDPLEGRA